MTKEQLKRANEIQEILTAKKELMKSTIVAKKLSTTGILKIGDLEVELTAEQVQEFVEERHQLLIGETIELEQEFRAL